MAAYIGTLKRETLANPIKMDLETITYIYVLLASGAGGYTRFADSERNWNWRRVSASVLVGAIGGVLFVALVFDYWMGHKVVEYRFLCYAIGAAIGFLNPKLATMIQGFSKAIGIDLKLEKTS